MLHIINLEEIHRLLLCVPKLIDRLERRDPLFVQDVKRWLTTLEEILVNNRMPAVGSIATLRGVISASERGVIPAGIVFYGRPTARKVKEVTAADVLRHANELVSSAVREDNLRISEAERLSQQLVALAKSKGLLSVAPTGGDRTQELKGIWRAMSADSQIAPGAVHLEGLLGQNDVLVVLDRAIPRT